MTDNNSNMGAIKKHVDDRERTNNLRDHFAGLAMQAIISRLGFDEILIDNVATNSYKLADEMLKAREVKSENRP